jgi:hypothetical protein
MHWRIDRDDCASGGGFYKAPQPLMFSQKCFDLAAQVLVPRARLVKIRHALGGAGLVQGG